MNGIAERYEPFLTVDANRAAKANQDLTMSRSDMAGVPFFDWGATRIGPDSELELYRKALPITDEKAGVTEMNGFPDLLFAHAQHPTAQADFTGHRHF